MENKNMESKKNFFEKAIATFFLMFGIVVMFMCVIVFYNKMSARYILTTKAQTWTDALGDAAACWSSERGGFNKDEALDKFNEMKHFAIEDFPYYADFKIDFDNEHNGLYDIIYVSCTFEYPWFASTSSQQAFHSVLTYPKKTVSTQLNYIHNGNEDIISYKIALPGNRMEAISVPEFTSSLSDHKLQRNMLQNFAMELMTTESSRYMYVGTDDTLFGNLSAQNFLTQDILYILGNPTATIGKSADDIRDYLNNQHSDWQGNSGDNDYFDFESGKDLESTDKNGTSNVTVIDTMLTVITDNAGQKYICINNPLIDGYASVITPDGLGSVSVDNITYYDMYPITMVN